MANLRVLVAGASIAGPTTAYWLAKAGAQVTVIERFPALRTNGQNVDIRTAGVTVMRKMDGMEAAVRAKTMPMDGLSFMRADGTPYATIHATGNPDQQSLISEYEIFRGDLGQILYDMTKESPTINYVFGEQVKAIQQHEKGDGPVTVEFANGVLPRAEYDLVVACDGATSRTRSIGLGCGVRDFLHTTNCWAAYFTIPQNLLEGSRLGQAYSTTGGRFIAVAPDPADVSRIGLMKLNSMRESQDVTLPFRAAMKQGDAALKQFITEQYRDAGWRSEEIMAALESADDLYAKETVAVKVPALSKGRFVLVGDAGYAPSFTGGGTTLAMAGGYLLAGELSRNPKNLPEALRSYEERMRPLIRDMQQVPPLVPTVFAPQTAWGIWFRNSVIGFVVWTGILNFMQKHFAGAFANSDKYELPEYEWVA